jgi:hypothetical protein
LSEKFNFEACSFLSIRDEKTVYSRISRVGVSIKDSHSSVFHRFKTLYKNLQWVQKTEYFTVPKVVFFRQIFFAHLCLVKKNLFLNPGSAKSLDPVPVSVNLVPKDFL